MRHWYYILYFTFFITATAVYAQHPAVFTIKGKVTDKSGVPLQAVSIVLDSNLAYAQTDSTGKYQLKKIPAGAHTLTIQAFGYKEQYKSISGKKGDMISLNFSLEEDVLSMDEVIIVKESEKQKLENSAKAVHVIDTKEAKLKSADMGEVLAQTQGVSVRRSGGLGSNTRFSLNGLTGDQVRFFLDGVPLEFSGYTFGIANVPVNLIDRIEIYKGVVPIQFGADALGGAVNIISNKVRRGFSGSTSYQTGSFGTHRLTLDLTYLADSSGLFISGGGFYDYSKNNYKVDVEVPNEKGKLQSANVRRFHDAYRGQGVNLTLGVKNKSWAKELSVKGFYSGFNKEVQHNNLSMEGIPYGEIMNLRSSAGVNLTYRQDFSKNVALDAVAGYNYSERQFIDTSHCVYDWYGNCIIVNLIPGEREGSLGATGASFNYTWDKNYFTRLLGTWRISKNSTIRFSSAPTFTRRTGKEEFATAYDPSAAIGRMFNWVNGSEYELDAFSGKLENILFVKQYFQNISIEEATTNNSETLTTSREVNFYGIGNGVRYQFTDRISAKASYEYAIRLPRPDELFGDGLFISKNLELKPERSHNVNLEFTYKNKKESKYKWFVQPNIFLREIDNLIFLHLGEFSNVYKNLANAVSTGVEFSTGLTAPDDKLNVTINTTYQHYYNNSREGDYESFRLDRMPNMPYFFSNGFVSYSFKNFIRANTQLTPFWNMRYVQSFYNSWESAGKKSSKKEVPNQNIHSVGVTYRIMRTKFNWAITGEIQNIFNVNVYDFYRVQKPGRACYIKLTVQF